ncbi:MAG: Rnf-Nqr domain containing protein [Acutalibacteraceae bacterium]
MKRSPWPIFWSTFLKNNIVLVKAVGICPIIAGGTTLKNGVALTVCTLAVLLPSCLFMAGMGDKIPKWLHPPVYTLAATLMMVGASAAVSQWIAPEIYASLYLFLPLMVVSTIFTYHAGGFSAGTRPLFAAADAVGSALGFGLVICVVSALREAAATGTVWDLPLPFAQRFPSGALPFAAFILLGLMAAGLQAAQNRRRVRKEEDA